jgi:hypothetical protein
MKNLTRRLVAAAYGVSEAYLGFALQLTPEQRNAVRQGLRPLVPQPACVVRARKQLASIAGVIGTDAAINLLTELGR